MSTVSPTFTIGFAGAPMCMETGRITWSGAGMASMGLVFVAALYPGSECGPGCMPPRNVYTI